MSDLRSSQGLRHPVTSIFLTLFIVLVVFQLIGPLIGMLIAYPFYPGSPDEFQKSLEDPFKHPELRSIILIMQGCGAFFGLIVVPYFLLRAQGRDLRNLLSGQVYPRIILISILVVLISVPLNSFFIEWNKGITLPWGDDWFRGMEKKLEEGTKFLIQFNSPLDTLGVLIVIAILPAIGEEIVFRGMIQKDLYRATGNIHVAIWVAAILFSAIHIQFLGFVPRMLLGALFGYLYYWSGSLWMAILGHFVNNGFALGAMYLQQRGVVDADLENTSLPWQAVLVSALCTALLLYSFKTFFNHNPKSDIPD